MMGLSVDKKQIDVTNVKRTKISSTKNLHIRMQSNAIIFYFLFLLFLDFNFSVGMVSGLLSMISIS